jgi:glutaredoxin-like protein NrdH
MANLTHVEGKKKGDILLYALSTCVWCKKTKSLLDKLGVDYYYVYADLLDENENKELKVEIRKWNPKCSFPTIVINSKECIIGFDEDKIRKELS